MIPRPQEKHVPRRSRRVVVIAHCHLNANTKVHGIADYPGVRAHVVQPLLDRGVGLIQLPCPECVFLGMNRWGMTREQYDHAAFREHCVRLLTPIVTTLVELSADGCVIESVIGVDGSPSCGVNRTCVGYEGGEIEALFESGVSPEAHDAAMPGVFMEVLQSLLAAEGLDIAFVGHSERDE